MQLSGRIAKFRLISRKKVNCHLGDLDEGAIGLRAQKGEYGLQASIADHACFQWSEIELRRIRLHVEIGKNGVQRFISQSFQRFRREQGAEKGLPCFFAHTAYHKGELALACR